MKIKKIPQRRCLGCDTLKDKQALVRIVRTPQGEVLLDKTGKMAGRGAYVCPQVTCVETALNKKRVERALEVTLSPELKQQLLDAFKNE